MQALGDSHAHQDMACLSGCKAGSGRLGRELCSHGRLGRELCSHGSLGRELCSHGSLGRELCSHGRLGRRVRQASEEKNCKKGEKPVTIATKTH